MRFGVSRAAGDPTASSQAAGGPAASSPAASNPSTDDPSSAGRTPVEVRRSARRRRTVSAYRENGVTIVLLPATMSRSEERRWVDVMVRRLDGQDRRRRPSDAALLARAGVLSTQYLGGTAHPTSVRWVTNQATRWGSCTPSDGSVRLSSRLRGMPAWVVDYVLLHELAHLLVREHSAKFWALIDGYPRAERARGYLQRAAEEGSGPDRSLEGDSAGGAPDRADGLW